MTILRPLAAVALAAGLAASISVAAQPRPAEGTFESRGFKVPIIGAIAFRGKSAIDKESVIVVPISNSGFRTEWFANFTDRRRAVSKRFEDSESAVIYLEFKPDGAYRGMSYYLRQGNNCGYCGGNMGVTSTVKATGGKLAGTIKLKDESRTMDVKLDVPIMSDDFGSALPAGGGEPGKAYLAYHDALVKRDPKAVREVISNENREWFDEQQKKGKIAGELNAMAKEHPDKTVRIVRGYTKGNRAVLLLEGESSVLRLSGEAALMNEGGRWRMDDELFDVVLN